MSELDNNSVLSQDFLDDPHNVTLWTRARYWLRQKLHRTSDWRPQGIPLYDLDSQGRSLDDSLLKRPRSFRWLWQLLATVLFAAITLTVVIGVISTTGKTPKGVNFDPHNQYWNGSHAFYPLTVVVSLDGFHPSLISERFTPFLHGLYTLNYTDKITSSPYMFPSFPSQTFPNHWTLVTGKYPRDHGIVSNVFWDQELQEEFHPGVLDPRVWANASTPIWEVLQTAYNHQGNFPFKVAAHMWPGSDVDYSSVDSVPRERTPYYKDDFDAAESLDAKLKRVLEFVDMGSLEERPQLVLSYVPQVDAFGHHHGYPIADKKNKNFREFTEVLSGVDRYVEGIVYGLEARNVSQFANVIIVSDHGMSNIENPAHIVVWEDLLDKQLRKRVEHAYGEGPMLAVTPRDHSDTNELYREITKSLKELGDLGSKFTVYLNGNFPERFQLNDVGNKRIAPIWIIPEPGYAVMNQAFAKKQKDKIVGNHGYDNHTPEMRSLFIAMGPFFERGYVEPFENVELFDLLCDLNGVAMRDRFGDTQDTLFYKKFMQDEFEDDFAYLETLYGNGTSYNQIWAGETEEEEDEDEDEDEDDEKIEGEESESNSDSESDSDSEDEDVSEEPTPTSSAEAATATATASSWLDSLTQEAEELVQEVVDEIQDLINNNVT